MVHTVELPGHQQISFTAKSSPEDFMVNNGLLEFKWYNLIIQSTEHVKKTLGHRVEKRMLDNGPSCDS